MLSFRIISGLSKASSIRLSLARMSSVATSYKFQNLEVTQPHDHVIHVQLNRPQKMNSMDGVLWKEIGVCFDQLAADPECRAIVLSGAGKLFSAGIDVTSLTDLAALILGGDDVARKAVSLRKLISEYQASFTAIEQCNKPVIAAVHNACIGGAVDMLCATDIRYCSSDAYFQVKEVDMGLAADVGTLQRLPKIVGSASLVNDLCLTCRKMYSDEALQAGLVSRVFSDKESLLIGALKTAASIASKSPVAVQGTKEALVFSRDHSVEEGLNFMVKHNVLMLQSEDLRTAATSQMSKEDETPAFSNL